METSFSPIPWNTPARWQEAHFAFCHAIEHHHEQLTDARHLAVELHKEMIAVFPLMDRLCGVTCPSCPEVCCKHAWVWLDYKDLLFLHLAGIQLPEAQLLDHRGERCRYLGPNGCRLDRIQRPFVCTYYLCPAQTQFLREDPTQLHGLNNCLQRIKSLRTEMEHQFIAALVRNRCVRYRCAG